MPKKPQKNLSDWSISTFYSKAWALTKEHKRLWILGLAVTVFASGGSSNNFNFGDMFDSESQDESYQYEDELSFLPTSVEAQTKNYVLQTVNGDSDEPVSNELDSLLLADEANNPDLENVEELEYLDDLETFEESEEFAIFFGAVGKIFQDVFKSLPLWIYPLFALELLFFIVYAVVFSFFASSWAKAALIKGIEQADTNTDWSLTEVSQGVLKNVKSIIWLAIVPTIAIVFFTLAVIAATAVLTALIKDWGWISILFAVIGLVYVWFKYLVAATWAIRHCVLENMTGMQSIKQGWVTASGTLFKTFRLGIANTIASMIVSVLVFLPVIGVAMATVIPQIVLESFSPIAFIPAVVLFLITLPINGLIQGILSVFRYATWHYGFIVVNQNRNEAK